MSAPIRPLLKMANDVLNGYRLILGEEECVVLSQISEADARAIVDLWNRVAGGPVDCHVYNYCGFRIEIRYVCHDTVYTIKWPDGGVFIVGLRGTWDAALQSAKDDIRAAFNRGNIVPVDPTAKPLGEVVV